MSLDHFIIRKNANTSWKPQNVGYRILTSELIFFDVLRSQVIILEPNVIVMNKSQAEKKIYAFHAVFRVDVNPFQNPTETSLFDHYIDPQTMPRLFKTMNRWFIQTLLLLTLFQQFTTWGQAGYAHTKMIT